MLSHKYNVMLCIYRKNIRFIQNKSTHVTMYVYRLYIFITAQAMENL